MATKTPKVRIVRCPKCLKLLPEMASLSLYQCGKCGTILRAKERNENQESEISDTLGQNLAPKTELEHDSEDKESTSSSQKALSCSTDGSEQVEHQEFAMVNSSSRRISNGSTSLDALNWCENEPSSSVSSGSGEDGKLERGSDLENPSSARQGISGGSNLTAAAQKSFKSNVSSSSEELERSEKIVRRYADLIRSKSPVRIVEATDNSITSGDDRLSNKIQGKLEASKPSTTKTLHVNVGSVSSSNGIGDQVPDLHRPKSKESFSGPQMVAELKSANTGNLREDVSVNRRVDNVSKVQNEVNKLSSMSLNEKHSPVTDDSIISGNDMVTDKHRGELRSSEPLATSDSVSSSDGWDDQDLHSRLCKESSLGSQSAELITTTKGAMGREVSVNNRIGIESEVRNRIIESSLMLVNEKHGPVTDDMVTDNHRDEFVVSNSLGTKTFHAYNESASSSDGWCNQDHLSHQSAKYFPKYQRVNKLIAYHEKATRKDDYIKNMIDAGWEVQNQERNLPLVSVNEKHGQVNDNAAISEDEIIGNKLGGVLEDAKPFATKTLHAYDASISSNDGWGDQVSDFHSHQPLLPFDKSHRGAELVSNNKEVTRDEVPLNNMVSSETEVRNQTQKASPKSVNERHCPTILSDVSPPEGEIAAKTRYPFYDQMNMNVSSLKSAQTSFKSTLSWFEEERDGLKSMQHFDQRNYENRNLPPPQKLETVERNQLELLRKVDELSNQLNRSYAHSRNTIDRLPPKGNQQQRQLPFNHKKQSLPDLETSHQYGVDFPRHPHGTYKPSNSMPFQYGYPLSGNVTNYRNHTNCSCSSVYSEELQQANVHYSGGQCRAYPDHVCYSLYSSGPSSPERHLHSRYPLRSCELCTVFRDHTDRVNNVESLPRRERRQSVKRHCRPIAGGAPFIACYKCCTLLYLPADSFLSSKGCHKLQCGSCSKVLMFSLERGIHVAPYYQEKVMLAPSVINSSRGSNSTRLSVYKLRPRDNHGDPSAYFEDGGLSILDGGSMDGESADSKPALGKHAKKLGNNKKNGTRAKRYGKRQVLDSGSPSYNEAESAREGGIAALHELMGYSTVSRILKSSGDV